MQNSAGEYRGGRVPQNISIKTFLGRWGLIMAAICVIGFGKTEVRADTNNTDPSDPILNLFLQKGFITQSEADKARAEVQALRTNNTASELPPSKWSLDKGIKNVELFGDVRFRFEDRESDDPSGGKIDLQRFRYALRFGFRGDAFDDFYYGFRLETASNPRSPWVTFGTSSSGYPYQGPFGKSTAGIAVGQIYLGWHPESWVDITMGKMPNPLYTTPMVWDSDLNPEGLAERFKYTVGEADFSAMFGQFLYADQNPSLASPGLDGLAGSYENGQSVGNNVFLITYSGGILYHITTNITAKIGATVYTYYGAQQSTSSGGISPYFGDVYVGEGSYTGPGSQNPYNGYSGYGTSGTLPGNESVGYPNNQVGINDLLVLEVPFELNFKIKNLDARLFGDVAYNFEGRQRAEAAASAYASYLASQTPSPATIGGFAPQTSDNKAYQFGFAIGNHDSLGLVYGTTSRKNAWEFRTYWQHVEQYSLDPNLIDSDFFEGAENLQGIYAAFAYSFTDNLIGTVRYGYASRINNKLGTGGSDQDIPEVNPISEYKLFQADLTFRF
jgi:Putative porin